MNDDDLLELSSADMLDCGNDDIRVTRESWNNKRSKPRKIIDCYINEKLIDRLNDIEKCVVSSLGAKNEFGCFIKGSFRGCDFYIDDDIYIPKQEVSAAAITFNEDCPKEMNGVVHRHPDGCRAFSGTDDQYINSNFQFSILFEGHTIRQGVINLKIVGSDAVIQVPLSIHIVRPIRQVEEFDVSMITHPQPKMFNIPVATPEMVGLDFGELIP